MAEHYDVGDLAVVRCTFAVNDTPTDPTAVTVKVRKPAGELTSVPASRESAGVYFAEIPITEAGFWRYRFVGDEPAPGVESGLLVADPDPFSSEWEQLTRRQLCTLEEAKDYAGESLDDTTFDPMFMRLIEDCSQAFYRYTGREFTPIASRSVDRTFDLSDWERRNRSIAVGDLASLTGLAVSTAYQDGRLLETVDPLSVIGLPRNRDVWEPFTHLWFPPWTTWPATLAPYTIMTVTGDWGFPEVPSDVRQLALVQVAIWFERDVAKFSGTFSLAEGHTIRPRMLDDAVRDGLDVGYRYVEVG